VVIAPWLAALLAVGILGESKRANAMHEKTVKADLYRRMFLRGLGELLMLRHKDDQVLLGYLTMEKGTLVFRDRGLLQGVSFASVAPCWDLGLVGAVADIPDNPWSSLSFLGPDLCTIPVDLSSTRHRVLGRVAAATGESVLSFYGSVYRGFKLMMDYNLLPVVLPLPIETERGVTGLAVTDFRFATVPIEVVLRVNDLVRAAADRHLTLSVEEVDVDDQEFERLFGRYNQ